MPAGLLALPGGAITAALALLAVALEGTVSRAVQRRFDATLRWYRAALAAGGTGVALSVALAAGAIRAGSTARIRDAHVLLNLLGLLGLVVAGTLPFFVATQARMRMPPRRPGKTVHRAGKANWLDLGFTSAQQGVVINEGNVDRLLVTFDGGQTWRPAATP